MKKSLLFIAIIFLFCLSASARLQAADDAQPSIMQPTEALASVTDVTEGMEVKINGYLMENYCLKEENPENILEFSKMHPKNCMLLPICIKSGFLVVSSDNSAYQFDAASADRIVSYLEEANNSTHVKVIIKKAGEKYHLVSIDNLG